LHGPWHTDPSPGASLGSGPNSGPESGSSERGPSVEWRKVCSQALGMSVLPSAGSCPRSSARDAPGGAHPVPPPSRVASTCRERSCVRTMEHCAEPCTRPTQRLTLSIQSGHARSGN
jgi:hypothetical protein